MQSAYRHTDPTGEAFPVYIAYAVFWIALDIYLDEGCYTGTDFAWSLMGLVNPFHKIKVVANMAKGAKGGCKVFWSGGTAAKEAAEAFAKKTGGKTLEMTPMGKILNSITNKTTFKYLAPAWNVASKQFAKGAGGSANVFHSGSSVRLKSVWATKEFPQLIKQGTKITYHVVP